MAAGLSLHIGLNKIDANHYASTQGQLKGSENDARAMQKIAVAMGFSDVILLSPVARRDNVIKTIKSASQKLQPGDFFFLTYSGHGGLIPNLNNDPEPVGFDQTFCLFDAQLVDDELKKLWAEFRPGVRILVVTDCCYSGTILKFKAKSENAAKILSPQILKATYEQNKNFYNGILKAPNAPNQIIHANVMLLASCRDNQQSVDGPINSLFTEHLLDVWHNGAFNGNYQKFIDDISNLTPLSQIPQLKIEGPPNQLFLNSQPFKI